MFKKPDLNEIPERFHILFNSDWNLGNDSNMKIEDRMECERLYLEYNKWKIREAIIKTISTSESDKPKGFIKD